MRHLVLTRESNGDPVIINLLLVETIEKDNKGRAKVKVGSKNITLGVLFDPQFVKDMQNAGVLFGEGPPR